MKFIAIALFLTLAGCAAQQQRELSATFLAQQTSSNTAKQQALAACATSADVSGCMLGVGLVFASGNSGAQIPVVQSDLSALTGLVGVIAPVAGAIIQSGHNRDIALGAQNAQTAQAASQWGAIGGMVRDTTSAQSAAAASAVNGITAVSIAASNNNAATATAYAQTLGLGFAMLPELTPSINAGGNVVQGDGNDFSTDIRRDTLSAGTELRIGSPGPFNISTQYELVCTTGNTGNGGSGTVPGASGSAGAQTQTCTFVPRGP